MPKLVRGQVATDILIKPSAGAGATSTATMSAQYSKAVSGSSDASKQGRDIEFEWIGRNSLLPWPSR